MSSLLKVVCSAVVVGVLMKYEKPIITITIYYYCKLQFADSKDGKNIKLQINPTYITVLMPD